MRRIISEQWYKALTTEKNHLRTMVRRAHHWEESSQNNGTKRSPLRRTISEQWYTALTTEEHHLRIMVRMPTTEEHHLRAMAQRAHHWVAPSQSNGTKRSLYWGEPSQSNGTKCYPLRRIISEQWYEALTTEKNHLRTMYTKRSPLRSTISEEWYKALTQLLCTGTVDVI